MSYDLAVWNPGGQLRPEEAGSAYGRLCEGDLSDVAATDRIRSFVTELTARYPQIDDVPDEEVDDCPWSTAFDQSPGHVILSMSSSRVEEVAPYVYHLAEKHCLALFNPQEGHYNRPGVWAHKWPMPAKPATSYKAFEKAILSECQEQLGALGMVKRKVGIYTLDLPSRRRYGRLGLATRGSRNPVWVKLCPYVAVTDLDVERANSKLLGLRFHPYEASTIFMPLGYLMPKHRFLEWEFTLKRQLHDKVTDMVRSIAKFGIPVMRSHDDIVKIIEKMTQPPVWGTSDSIKFSLPIALAIAGRREEAEQFIERKLEEYSDARYPAAEQFRSFAARFAEWEPDDE